MIFRILLLAGLLISGSDCRNTEAARAAYQTVQGETMGTYFRVIYAGANQTRHEPAIVSLLEEINAEVNTYLENSTISTFNRTNDTLDLQHAFGTSDHPEASRNGHFITNYQAAQLVYEQSRGDFDPTIMPLVNYWGFGYTPKRPVVQADSVAIDSLRQLVGFNKAGLIVGDRSLLYKSVPGLQLDFSALAKGYGVDAIGRLLEKNGVEHYLVDIGGESRARGQNDQGEVWKIGINTPSADADPRELERVVQLKNASIATSGNYRNFYEVDGKRYAHTINPHTGYPQGGTLLSASIITDECMMADAYATACMVKGYPAAVDFINQLPGVEGLFIYANTEGGMEIAKSALMDDYLLPE